MKLGRYLVNTVCLLTSAVCDGAEANTALQIITAKATTLVPKQDICKRGASISPGTHLLETDVYHQPLSSRHPGQT